MGGRDLELGVFRRAVDLEVMFALEDPARDVFVGETMEIEADNALSVVLGGWFSGSY